MLLGFETGEREGDVDCVMEGGSIRSRTRKNNSSST